MAEPVGRGRLRPRRRHPRGTRGSPSRGSPSRQRSSGRRRLTITMPKATEMPRRGATSRSRDRAADARLGRHPARAPRAAAAPAGGAAAPRAGAGRGPRARPCLRGLSHRPAPGRGRPPPSSGLDHPRPRGGGRRGGVRARSDAVRGGGPGRHRVAAPHLRGMPFLPFRSGEPLRAVALHRWDADGGYAEFAVVPEAFAYRLPDGFTDEEAAPLLCAGIIGYRSLLRAELPPGGRLGLYGFGASAHLTAQVAIAQGAEVHVLTRGPQARQLARDLGAASVGDARDAAPVPLDSAIIFAPAGDLCRWPWRPSGREEPWRWRGSTSARSPAGLPAAPVPRAQRPLRHQQHPPRRRGVPHPRGPARAAAQHHGIPLGPGRGRAQHVAAGDLRGAAVLRVFP